MPEGMTRPDLSALMEAYGTLHVRHRASPLDIRRAYKRLLRQNNPAWLPAGTPEPQQAADQVAAANIAYLLIREAPLRHHRISTGIEPDTPWTEEELDAAWSRARTENVMSYVLGIALGVTAIALYSWFLLPLVWEWNVVAGPLIAVAMVAVLAVFVRSRVPSSVHLWRAIGLYRTVAGLLPR
jgi:hypothetical protein